MAKENQPKQAAPNSPVTNPFDDSAYADSLSVVGHYAVSAMAFCPLYLLAALATYLLSLLKSDMSDTCFIEIVIFSTIGLLTGAFATAIFCSDRFTHRVARTFQFLFRRAPDAST